MHNSQKNIHEIRIIIQKDAYLYLRKEKTGCILKTTSNIARFQRSVLYDFYRKKGTKNMIKAGIIGATGYAGGELVRILMGHKDVEVNGTVPEAISIRNMRQYTRICFR